MHVEFTQKESTVNIWHDFREEIGISRSELYGYLKGLTEGYVIKLNNPIKWQTSITLSELRTEIGIEPAQSFRYLTLQQLRKIQRLVYLGSMV